MIAEKKDDKLVLNGVFCTEEIEEDFNKIARDLKEVSAWYHVNGIAGGEVDHDEWEVKISQMNEIVAKQGEIWALYAGLADMMMEQVKKSDNPD